MTPPNTLGIPKLSDHALDRIRERWGIADAAAAHLWAIRRMAEASRVSLEDWREFTNAPRLLWWAGDVRIATDGNVIITAYSVADGEMEAAG